jgi:acetolactate synthase-1/2/3 large subunit
VDISGDYTMIAKGLGAYAERVEAPSEIIPALDRAREELDEGKPALLEVIVKPEGMPGY